MGEGSPEVDNNHLHRLYIKREIVVSPRPCSLTQVVVDEPHHSVVIRKLDEEVAVVC